MATIPIRRFIKVNNDYRVYDAKAKDYWQGRQYTNASHSMYGSGVLTKLFRKESGKCGDCKVNRSSRKSDRDCFPLRR